MSSDAHKYYFDEAAARRVLKFIETFCTHVTGDLMGKPIKLLEFQREIISNAFGWKRKSDGLRRYRYVYVEIPKKNGKSLLLSAIGLYLFLADGEPGAEVYSVAGDREQARIIFEASKRMVEQHPRLRESVEIYRDAIVHAKSNSVYKVLSSDVRTKHGPNIHGLLFDELHVQPNSELYDTLTKGIAARRQPMVWMITTAGLPGTFAETKHDFAKGILEGRIESSTWLPYIWAADPDDDPFDPEVWRKANPALGITIKEGYFEQEAETAKNDPTTLNAFKRLHLNIWTGAYESWEIMTVWDQCDRGKVPLDEFEGMECYIGLDLAAVKDTTAVVLLFPDPLEERFTIFPFFFIPEDTLHERRKENELYDRWVRDELVRTTPGNTTDQRAVLDLIKECQRRFDLRSVGYDPWNAYALAAELEAEGIPANRVNQNLSTLSPPLRYFEKMVVAGAINHQGNPVLAWQAGNVKIYEDINGNRRIHKKASKGRIDGIAATINAFAEYLRLVHADDDSPYKDEGIFFI